ncbi:MAG: hypothetical protein ACRDU4_09415, partial [Mycobacterium sp.]
FSTASPPEEGPQPRDAARQTTSCRADPMTATGQLSCPSAGSFVAASGQFVVAVVNRQSLVLLGDPTVTLQPL